ncbi:MAG: DUF721 domain-containing protein [Actinomycetota bacterium]|nr:DUF721 domain-containing protein [Actinomycetota bacterium]
MYRLSETIEELSKKKAIGIDFRDVKAILAWDKAVGQAIAENTEPVKIIRGILYVKTKSPAWAQELKALSSDIISKLNKEVGKGVIKEIRLFHDSSFSKE